MYSLAIIEDNPADMKLFRIALDDADFPHQVCEIPNCGSAFQSLLTTKTPPHLVLTDANLPAMALEEVLTHIKRSEACRNVPIIVISGMTNPQLAENAVKWGAAEYIQKPSDLDGWVGLAKYLKKVVVGLPTGKTS
jgi:DNA-binding NtrC family response regulator